MKQLPYRVYNKKYNHIYVSKVASNSDEEEIMLPTLLKDKTGEDLYEGDYIKYTYRIYEVDNRGHVLIDYTDTIEGVIQLYNGAFCVNKHPIGGVSYNPQNIEKIGDIHTRPDLIDRFVAWARE